MEQTTQKQTKNLRGLLLKKPFCRLLSDDNLETAKIRSSKGEKVVIKETAVYMEETQLDFKKQWEPSSHAINDRNIYKNFREAEDGLYYEEDFPRYAFAYQQEIFNDRSARLTGNDIQFDLSDKANDEKAWNTYAEFKAGWADKRMENAWHFAVKSDGRTGDVAFVGFMMNGKFEWKILSYLDDDVLYPHYDFRTGKLNILARTYSSENEDGETHNYVDVWDDKYYYRLSDYEPFDQDTNQERTEKSHSLITTAGEFDISGYSLEYYEPHGFPEIPVSYHRREDGPFWSPSQETIEHREAAFSRLAQSNHDFGLPIMYLKGEGKKIKEIATKDMSYASKIFIIPKEGEAGFLNRQDASGAYKTELDMLEDKIYQQSMVIKAPELKSGDTPAAAIKLLYSDAYNMAMLEAQEYDAFVCKMIEIFKWGYGIESENRLAFMNTRISFYIVPFLPVNDAEVTTNLATAVQNGFCSKQTASEKFYFSTPQEWKRIQAEKKEAEQQELLLEKSRLEIQQDNTVETQEQLSEINADQQIEVMKAQAKIDKKQDDDNARKVSTRKGSVATGRGAGRPKTVGTDKNGNRANENNWDKWNETH